MKLRHAGLLFAGMSLAACSRLDARLDIESEGRGTTNPPVGSHTYQTGVTVEVTAIPAAGATFERWSGAATSTANRVAIVVEGEQRVVAHFSADASSGGGSSGGSSGGASSSSSSSGGGSSSGSSSSGASSSGSSSSGASSSSSSSSGASSSSSSSSGASSSSSSSGGGSSSGSSSSGASSSSSSGGGASSSGGGAAKPSTGCGKASALKNSPGNTFNYNSITSGGRTRQYLLRLPASYDSSHPYRLILGFHGATGNATHVAGNPAYFGLYDLSNGSTIFAAPDAVGGIWSSAQDLTLVDDMLEQIEADLCIDTARISLEGFSQGGAMAFTLACSRPDVFRAAVVHSGGGLALPRTCQPIAYFSSLGQQESSAGQTMTSDSFAKTAGCTVESLPKAPGGGHLCSDYKGCSAGHPVRWCPYDGGHTASPNDSGQRTSWMPQEVWSFLNQF